MFIFKKVLQDYAFKKADLIHAWGKVMADHMVQSRADMTKVLLLPKGINLKHFVFKDRQDSTFIEAIVTRALEPEYKHEDILKAFGLLKKKNIPFRLVIVGDGSMRKTLEKLAVDLHIEKDVIFKGRTPNHEVALLLQEANFYISMPTTEGVSASLFEAMACGCFPIVSDLPGNRSWIRHQENGILIPNGKFKIVAEEIQYAAERTIWRKAVVARNRKFVEEQANYALNMKRIAEAYHELINSKTSAK